MTFQKGNKIGPRFKKGYTPWNKNKKLHYSVWNKNKKGWTNKGSFKKGQHPSPSTEFKKGQFSGSKHPNYKSGKVKSRGYILILRREHPFATKHGYVREQRLIIEKIIGRYLLPHEKIHHLNGIKDDNRPKNLMAFTSESAHQRFHHNPDNVKKSEIIFDGRKLANRDNLS